MDETQQQAPYTAMAGAGAPPPAQPGNFGSMVNPQPDISQMQRPPATPEELEQRKAGWANVLQNPNFMRALGVVGAHMMQPTQPGQSRMGQMGVALNAGQTAMQMGDYAQFEQDQAKAKEARAATESTAGVESTQAGTAEKKAKLPGVQAESDVAAATVNDKVAAASTARKQAELNLTKATKEEEIAAIERDLRTRKANIEKEIPDEALRKAALAEVDAAVLKVDEARARIASSKAATEASGASTAASKVKTAHDQITVDTLKDMDKKELKEFLTKTGRYSQHTSGIGQQSVMWGEIYDKLPADDVKKQGKTREQFQMDQLTSAKGKDAADTLTKYMAAGGDDAEVISGLTDLVKQSITGKKGTPAPGAANTEVWVRDKNGKLVKQKQAPAAASAASGPRLVE